MTPNTPMVATMISNTVFALTFRFLDFLVHHRRPDPPVFVGLLDTGPTGPEPPGRAAVVRVDSSASGQAGAVEALGGSGPDSVALALDDCGKGLPGFDGGVAMGSRTVVVVAAAAIFDGGRGRLEILEGN